VEARFGLEPGNGLAEILLGHKTLREVVRPTRIRNLAVLGPGIHRDGLTHRIVSEEMFQLQELAEKEFTHIIFDSPPELVMADAALLAPLVDGVIIVAGVDASSRGMLQRCLNDILRTGAETLGVVLNGVRSFKGGYLRHNYDLHYDYEDMPPAPPAASGEAETQDEFRDDELPVPLLLPIDRGTG
jgi:Mrp family chromosome partitioning ATPase